jgi:hypothetical protein
MHRLLPLAALLCLTSCLVPTARVDLAWGPAELDGDVSAVDTSGGPTSAASASTDSLGLDDAEGVLRPRVSVEWVGFELMVDHASYSWSGNGTANVDLEFDDFTIQSGDDVASDLDMSLTTAMLFVDVIPTDVARLGLGLGVTYVDEELSITSLTLSPGTSAGSDEAAPVPVVGVHAGVGLGPIDVDVLARGLTVDVDDVEATFLDLDAAVVWSFFGRDHLSGNLRVGWRQVGLDVEYDDGDSAIELDLEASGPYIGLGVVF